MKEVLWHHGCLVCLARPPDSEKVSSKPNCYKCGTPYHGSCAAGVRRGCGFDDCTWPKCVLNWKEVDKATKAMRKQDKELSELLKRS